MLAVRGRTRRFTLKGLCLRPIAARWPVGSALLLLALAGPAMAATVSGTVTVPAGYSLAEATVTLNDANNHLYRVAADDTTGAYKIDDIAAGTYTLTVQAKGSEIAPIPNLVLAD